MAKRFPALFRNYFNARFEAMAAEIREVRGALNGNAAEPSTAATSFADAVSARLLEGVHESLDRQHDDLMSVVALLGRSVDQTADGIAELLEGAEAASGGATPARPRRESRDWLVPIAPGHVDLAPHRSLDDLDKAHADVANFAAGHRGWASQAGLWFNPPISVNHEAGRVSVADINERVAEIPFVYSSLGGLPRGSRVLDIGSCESTVAIGLASLGYVVTALDPRPYPLRHANLTNVLSPIEDFRPDEPFDAAILLSAIEHFGLGSYDLPTNEAADQEAMDAVWNALRPGGTLVLTTPYGDAPTTELERTYMPDQIDRLFSRGWDVTDRTYLTKVSRTEWRQVDDVGDLKGDHVVLIKATRVDV